MKKRILTVMLALALAVTASIAPAFAVSTAGLKQQRESEHFVFYCGDQDLEALDDLENALEGCYERVTTALGKIPSGKTNIYIYSDLKTYHNSIGRPSAPDYSVGQAWNGSVCMVSPLNPGPSHNYDSIIKVAVHEYVHVVVNLFGHVSTLLNEGVATYMADQFQQGDQRTIQADAQKDALPSLTVLNGLTGLTAGTAQYNIYTYGPAYVEFIIENFGFDSLIALLEGKSRSTVTGMSETELNEKWLEFLKTWYKDTPNLNKADSWAQAEIDRAVKKGFVPEDLQDNYRNDITRGQFCRMAMKYLEYETGKPIATILDERGLSIDLNAFEDTKDEYILAAYALGITNGTKKPMETAPGVFSPDGSFKREMAATMLARVRKALGEDVENAPDAGYTDIAKASSWAVGSINFCYANDIMGGTSSAPLTFSPDKEFTIQQSIATFVRMK